MIIVGALDNIDENALFIVNNKAQRVADLLFGRQRRQIDVVKHFLFVVALVFGRAGIDDGVFTELGHGLEDVFHGET